MCGWGAPYAHTTRVWQPPADAGQREPMKTAASRPTQTRPTTRSQPGAPVHHPEDAHDDGDAHGYGTDH